MDKYLILQFQTLEQAKQILAVINQVAAAWWTEQGFLVIDGSLVPKNMATGEDMLNEARVITWDTVKKNQSNVYFFTSPSSDERFQNWRNFIPSGVQVPLDSEFNPDWTFQEVE